MFWGMIFSFASTILFRREKPTKINASVSRETVLCWMQCCLGCLEGIEEIRESGSIMLMQTKTLAKRSVIYTVALLATVAIQKDWPPKCPNKGTIVS